MSLGLLILVRFGKAQLRSGVCSRQYNKKFCFCSTLSYLAFGFKSSNCSVFDENYLLSLLQYGLFPREGRYADNGLCYFTYIDKVLMQTQVIC